MSRLGEQFDEQTYMQIKRVAESGIVDDSDWIVLQKLLRCRLDNIIDSYQAREEAKENQQDEPNVDKFDLKSLRDEIMQMIDSFQEPPFTIQRICELLYSPLKYYDRVSTFLRALEKNLRVISPHDWPKSPVREPESSVSGLECLAAVPKLTPSELKRLADDPKWANERFPNQAAGLGCETSPSNEPCDPAPEPTDEPRSESATESKPEPTIQSFIDVLADFLVDPTNFDEEEAQREIEDEAAFERPVT